MRKRVFRSFDQARLKLARSATEGSLRLEILVTETRNITLPRQRTTKVICVFVVRIWHKTRFLMARLKFNVFKFLYKGMIAFMTVTKIWNLAFYRTICMVLSKFWVVYLVSFQIQVSKYLGCNYFKLINIHKLFYVCVCSPILQLVEELYISSNGQL